MMQGILLSAIRTHRRGNNTKSFSAKNLNTYMYYYF